MYLYSIILLGSIVVPLALSFDRKLRFYRQWKYLLPAITLVALFYLAADVAFTAAGVWGFNARYHLPLKILGLPLEEWLFFILIPYASIFLHDAVLHYFPRLQVSRSICTILSVLLLTLSAVALIRYHDRAYTCYIAILTGVSVLWGMLEKSRVAGQYYLTFGLILLPFFCVNALLTGTGPDQPVVWYHPAEITGMRLLSIPVEDCFYAFSLILFSLLLRTRLQKTN